MTMPYIQTAAGGAINPGVTFGVGQVVRVHFDEPIPDRKAAQAALVGADGAGPGRRRSAGWTTPTSTGAPGTTSRRAPRSPSPPRSYGKNLGNALYGQADVSTWFRVGAKHVSIADDNTKMVKVYSNDKLVKTMPTSMGRHISIPGDTGPIDLRTNSGPHVVVGGEKNIDMNSASFGLSKGANAYRTTCRSGCGSATTASTCTGPTGRCRSRATPTPRTAA